MLLVRAAPDCAMLPPALLATPNRAMLPLRSLLPQACLAADLPAELRGHPEFAFLAPEA